MATQRKRPVITVVEARPMNEVGFRSSLTSPTTSPPALPVNHLLSQTIQPARPLAPPPKPKNRNDGQMPEQAAKLQNNNVSGDLIGRSDVSGREKSDQDAANNFSEVGKPQVAKRSSVIRPDQDSEASVHVVDQAPKAKPEIAPRITKKVEAAARPEGNTAAKPMVKAKPTFGMASGGDDGVASASGDAQRTSSWRKGPTIIRPNSLYDARQIQTTTAAANSSAAVTTVTSAKADQSITWPALKPVESGIVWPALRSVGSTDDNAKSSGKAANNDGGKPPVAAMRQVSKEDTIDKGGNPMTKKRPTIIRPKVDAVDTSTTITDAPKSTPSDSGQVAAVGSSVVAAKPRVGITKRHSSFDGFKPESDSTRNDMTEELRARNNTAQPDTSFQTKPLPAVPQTMSTSQKLDSVPIQIVHPIRPQEPPKKQLPAKPPPPRPAPAHTSTTVSGVANNSGSDKTQHDHWALAEHEVGNKAPPRPAMNPPRRPPSGPHKHTGDGGVKQSKSLQGMPPSLPKRPTLGHPLFHYVVSGPHALALYDYKSTQKDELNFYAGEVIILNKWVNAEWLEGRTSNGEGIFPASFVDVIEPPAALTSAPFTTSGLKVSTSAGFLAGSQSEDWGTPAVGFSSGPRCLARFDYDGEEEGDLTFVTGDMICLVEKIGDDWLKGALNNGRIGIFPLSFVEIIEDLPSTLLATCPSSESERVMKTMQAKATESGNKVTALYDFQGQYGELFFQAGSVITVLSEVNTDWLYGELNGYRGQFPKDFVDHVPSGLPMFVKDKKAIDTKQEPADDGAPYGIALYDYIGQTSDELTFVVGDRITLMASEESDWLRGSVKGKHGLVPAGYVNIIRPLDDVPPRPHTHNFPSANVKPHSQASTANNYFAVATKSTSGSSDSNLYGAGSQKATTVLALYDFKGETAEDLKFNAGETIEVLEHIGTDWMRGRIDNRMGMFPVTFVQVL